MSLKFVLRPGIILLLLVVGCAAQNSTAASKSNGTSGASNSTAGNSTKSNSTSAASSTASAKPGSNKPPSLPPYCQQTLLQSYGLDGYAEPRKTFLAFCPNIQRSCCSKKDEMKIYEGQIIQGGVKGLRAKLENYRIIYNDLITAMTRVAKFATLLRPTIKMTNNCKIMANSITGYKFESISQNFVLLHKNYFDFHATQFEGFFCTLCDADSNPFIDITRRVVRMNNAMCRGTISQTLPFLLYHHVHVRKLLNLMVNFAGNCDAKGAYGFKILDEAKLRLPVRDRNRKLLGRCKRDIKGVAWLKSCRPICKRLSLVKLRKFFTPRLEKVQYITQFLNDNMQIIENQLATGAASPASSSGAGASAAPAAAKQTLRSLRLLESKHHRRQVKRQRRSLQSGPEVKPPAPKGSQVTYRSKILQDLQKAAYSTEIYSAGAGARNDLSLFTTIIEDPNISKVSKSVLKEQAWQLTVMFSKQNPTPEGLEGPPGYNPINADGLNPMLVSQWTYITEENFIKDRNAMFAALKAGPVQGELSRIETAKKKSGSRLAAFGSVMLSLVLVWGAWIR